MLPPFKPPAGLGANCQYPATPNEPAAKKVDPPKSGKVPTDPANISMSIATNQGPIGVQLENAKAPCTVNNFVSLAQKGYFNDTHCHRPDDRNGRLCCSAATRKATAPVARAISSPTSTRPTSTCPTILRGIGHSCIPAARWPWPTLGQIPTAASSSSSTRIRSCRRITPCSARSTKRTWASWTRSPGPERSTVRPTASPRPTW